MDGDRYGRNHRGSSNHRSGGSGTNYRSKSCTVEFDGSSKGNPGQAGAGAVVRAADGSTVARLRVGLGNATNNEAEYRGAIIGMEYARDNGYTDVRIQGDSQLVVKQVQDVWKTRSPNMSELCGEAKDLKGQFQSFEAVHVKRDYNSEADAQADRAVRLQNGEIEVDRY